MNVQRTEKQPVSMAAVIVAGVLAFLSLKYAAGFSLWPSLVTGVLVAGLAVFVRRRMIAQG